MVSMAEKDCDVLRFLWVDDVHTEQPHILEFRFTRVVFVMSPSPFLLNATIRHHLSPQALPAVQAALVNKLCKSFYVDDVITGAEDEEQAYQLFVNSKTMLKDGGFNLRKFTSNSPSLQTRVGPNETNVTMHPPDGSVLTLESEETYSSSTLEPGQRINAISRTEGSWCAMECLFRLISRLLTSRVWNVNCSCHLRAALQTQLSHSVGSKELTRVGNHLCRTALTRAKN